MVEHDRRPIDAQFVAPAEFGLGSEVTLGPEAAHHMNVLRLDFGARIGVVDGAGRVGGGTLVRLGRRDAVVAVDQMWSGSDALDGGEVHGTRSDQLAPCRMAALG
jgi:hypothetical protein